MLPHLLACIVAWLDNNDTPTLFSHVVDAIMACFSRLCPYTRVFHHLPFCCMETLMLCTCGRYVFGESPHGVYPIGPVLAGTVVPLCFPGMKVQAVSASNVFKVSIFLARLRNEDGGQSGD